MAWITGSGLGTWVISRVLNNKSFQDSALKLLTFLGDAIRDKINNPDQLMTLAENLKNNPKAVLGSVVKGTEAEKFVDPSVVAAAATVQASGPAPGG